LIVNENTKGQLLRINLIVNYVGYLYFADFCLERTPYREVFFPKRKFDDSCYYLGHCTVY
jgi:hypothetical protein